MQQQTGERFFHTNLENINNVQEKLKGISYGNVQFVVLLRENFRHLNLQKKKKKKNVQGKPYGTVEFVEYSSVTNNPTVL